MIDDPPLSKTTLFARNTPRFTIVTNFVGYIELGVVIVTTLWDSQFSRSISTIPVADFAQFCS